MEFQEPMIFCQFFPNWGGATENIELSPDIENFFTLILNRKNHPDLAPEEYDL